MRSDRYIFAGGRRAGKTLLAARLQRDAQWAAEAERLAKAQAKIVEIAASADELARALDLVRKSLPELTTQRR
ncbi:hypothetical protein [Mesorhizobium sp. Cs1299R1N3]|uniref:hypothetical protein n=1 Tax=Mesorhizobium sp. Cs1299R1N3 TaxID=3015173 RepID=UPI00301CB0B7